MLGKNETMRNIMSKNGITDGTLARLKKAANRICYENVDYISHLTPGALWFLCKVDEKRIVLQMTDVAERGFAADKQLLK